jgi:hypothetical protein
MRRRRLLLLAAFCGLFALLIFGFAIPEKRVQIGMEALEVEQILGGRSVRVTFPTDQGLKAFADSLMMQAPPGAVMMRWDGKHSSVHVMFDGDGKVAGVYYPRGSGHIINMILRSVGLD